MSHAVVRLRDARLARSQKPFLARGSRVTRCPRCRLPQDHCLCAAQPVSQATTAGICLLMHDTEPLKPSNTGWLIADVVQETWAFGWQRTAVDPELLALLQDPQWQPFIIFPDEYAEPERVVHQVAPHTAGKRPLFILLDATWPEARKMFRKSPYLTPFPVLSIQAEGLSRYRLRRSTRGEHLCTAEVAAACLELSHDLEAAQTLDDWLDCFTEGYLMAKRLPNLTPASAEISVSESTGLSQKLAL